MKILQNNYVIGEEVPFQFSIFISVLYLGLQRNLQSCFI